MLRPETFQRSYVVFRNIPYLVTDSVQKFSASVGVLSRGQVVWLPGLDDRTPKSVTAFVEEIGLISLDPRALVPADILTP